MTMATARPLLCETNSRLSPPPFPVKVSRPAASQQGLLLFSRLKFHGTTILSMFTCSFGCCTLPTPFPPSGAPPPHLRRADSALRKFPLTHRTCLCQSTIPSSLHISCG